MANLKKLQLNKEVIAKLNNDNMKNIVGGDGTEPNEEWIFAWLTGVAIGYVLYSVTQQIMGDCKSIGHDDGTLCVSKEANWCHGIPG